MIVNKTIMIAANKIPKLIINLPNYLKKYIQTHTCKTKYRKDHTYNIIDSNVKFITWNNKHNTYLLYMYK